MKMWLAVQLILSPLIFQLIRNLITLNENKILLHIEDEDFSHSNKETELTEVEKQQIERLRQEMGNELQLDFELCDDFLIRWLYECDMDVPCASRKLKSNLQWRRSTLLDIMKPNKTYLTIKQDPSVLQGRTKAGGPIILFTANGWDIRKLILTGNKENLWNHHIQLLEQYFQKSIWKTKNGKTKLTAGIAIGNFQRISLKQHSCARCITVYRDMANIFDKYYPRTFKFFVIINGPKFAKPFVQLLKSFLNPYFQETFIVFGENRQEWSRFLLKYISREELPEEFGGTVKRTSPYHITN